MTTQGKSRLWAGALLLTMAGILVPANADEPKSTEAEMVGADDARPAASTDEQMPESTRLFDEMLVVGSVEQAMRTPGSAHFISPQQVQRQGYADIHRVLRQAPGINIQEEDGYGLRPNIGIRGTGAERSQKITLLEDGVLIAPAPYAAPSAYYSPTAGRMESFEVRKGSGSIRQGPYTNGGAVNYISTSVPGSLRARVNLAAGGEGLQRAAAWVGDSSERYGWLLETYQLSADGFKSLDGGGDTGFDLDDYVGKFRVNSGSGAKRYQALEFKLGKTEQVANETYLGLAQVDFDRDPYRRYAASAGDNITTDHEQLQVSYFLQPQGRWNLTATAYRNDFYRNWFKLEKVAGTSVSSVLADPQSNSELLDILRGERDSEPGALQVRNNRREYFSEGVQAVLSLRPNGAGRHELDFGVRVHRDQEDRFQEEDRYQMVDGRRTFTALGVPGSQANRIADAEATAFFVQDTFTAGRWTWTPGVRVEMIDLERRDFGKTDPARTGEGLKVRRNSLTEVIPGLGVDYRINDSNRLFFGVHRGFSPPSPSSTEEVDAETSINYEAGWRHADDGRTVELVGFFNDYDNLLGNDTVSGGGQGTGDQFNGGEVQVAGLEAGFGLDLADLFSSPLRLPLRLAYTYTSAEFMNTFDSDFSGWGNVERGDEIPYIPDHQLYAGLSVVGKRWAGYLDANYTSDTRTQAGSGPIAESQRVDARMLFDLKAETVISERFKLWAQLLNATDEVYVAARHPAGLRPGRPRTALFGVTIDLEGNR